MLLVKCNEVTERGVRIHLQRLFIKRRGQKQAWVDNNNNRYGVGKTKSNPRTDVISLRRTVFNRARQSEIIQVHSYSPGRGKQSPNGETKG